MELNWMTQGLFDAEYKKYQWLAYLQACKENFKDTKLYPPLSELISHYRHLEGLKHDIEDMQGHFPKNVTGIDPETMQLQYEKSTGADTAMDTLHDIIEFAIPSTRETIDEGRQLYEKVEKQIAIEPVGLVPIYNSEGYLLLSTAYQTEVSVYQYKHTIISSAGEHWQSISLTYVQSEWRSVSNTIENIKLKLIKKDLYMPVPATYFCWSQVALPLHETLLPIAKRLLLKQVAKV